MEADPKTLEPVCDASAALHTIQATFPAAKEPLLVLVDAKDGETCHDSWTKIQGQWAGLVAAGKIKSFLSPTPFVLSPENARENLKQLNGVTWRRRGTVIRRRWLRRDSTRRMRRSRMCSS